MIQSINCTIKDERRFVVEKILREYESAEISTRRCFELLERVYVGDAVKKWDLNHIYATTGIDKQEEL